MKLSVLHWRVMEAKMMELKKCGRFFFGCFWWSVGSASSSVCSLISSFRNWLITLRSSVPYPSLRETPTQCRKHHIVNTATQHQQITNKKYENCFREQLVGMLWRENADYLKGNSFRAVFTCSQHPLCCDRRVIRGCDLCNMLMSLLGTVLGSKGISV